MPLRLPIFALLLLLTACNRNSDAQLQAKLPGTWKLSNPAVSNSINSTTTVTPYGTYDCVIVPLSSGITQTLAGTWQVRNGLLIDTTTRHSSTNAPLPWISTSSIVRLDSRELVLKFLPDNSTHYPTNEAVFHKVEK